MRKLCFHGAITMLSHYERIAIATPFECFCDNGNAIFTSLLLRLIRHKKNILLIISRIFFLRELAVSAHVILFFKFANVARRHFYNV